jgi:hypothetical protein
MIAHVHPLEKEVARVKMIIALNAQRAITCLMIINAAFAMECNVKGALQENFSKIINVFRVLKDVQTAQETQWLTV